MRRLLAAKRRADQDAQFLWRVLAEPFGHLPGLLFATNRKLALQVGRALDSFRVTP